VLVTSKAVVPEVVLGDGFVGPEMIVLALDRAGVDVVVDKGLDNRFGPRRAQPGRADVELRLVAGDPSPLPDGFRKVKTIDPLTRSERAERTRLETELDEAGALGSLLDAKAAIDRDPRLRPLLDRYNELGDATPLTLLTRELRGRESS
jgi:hypothetical protein